MSQSIAYQPVRYRPLPPSHEGLFSWLWFFIRPQKKTFALLTLNRVVRSLILSLQPFFIGKVINAVQSGAALEDPWAAFEWILFFVVISTIVYIMLLWGITESKMMGKLYRGMTLFCVDRLMNLSLTWHEKAGSGSKMQQIMTARDGFKRLMELYFYYYSTLFGTFLSVMVSIIFLDAPPFMIGLFVLFILSFIVVAMVVRRRIHTHFQVHNIAMERLASKIYDYVSAIRTVKSFALQRFIKDNAVEGETQGYNAILPVHRTNYTMWIGLNFTGLFWMVTIIVVGFFNIQSGLMSLGAFAALAALSDRLWSELEGIASTMNEFSEHKNGFLRIREIMKEPEEQVDRAPCIDFPQDWQTITFEKIGFSYEPSLPVINGIDLNFKRGSNIALVGRSGSGKSTLIKLLTKHILPGSGTITVDGQDMAHIRRDTLLARMALVPQDVELFNGTVRENILLDRRNLPEEEYQACLEKAFLKEFIETLPEKSQTEVGERGIKLSGGQRQRLGIARALARQADIIIFDEATSSLDSESEFYIQKALEESFGEKTLIIIAHRLSTIKRADWIYVLDKGATIEQGSFDALKDDSSVFSRLWKMQSDGFLP